MLPDLSSFHFSHAFDLLQQQPHNLISDAFSSTFHIAQADTLSSTTTTTTSGEHLSPVAEQALNALGRDVLIFLGATVVVVPLSNILGVTPVLTFLAVGCLLGPNGMGLFSNNEADLELGDFGILFLLFTEGLNLSPDKIRDLGKFGALGIFQILASMSLFFFGIWGVGPMILQYIAPIIHMDDYVYQIFSSPVQAFCIASAGALSSSAFVLPVLKAKNWEDKPEGVAALSILLLQDLAVAPLLVLLPLAAGSGPQTGGELGLLAAKATIGFGAVLALGSVILRYVFEFVAAARSTETFVAAALLVALSMGQVADALGLSATTGAFAAGVLLAGNRYRAQIKADVRPFEGILLGIFFMTAGASLDLGVVLHNLPTLLTGIAVFLAIKASVLFLGGPALGKSWAGAAKVAILLSGGGEFSLVLFNVAKDLGVLPKDLSDLLVASVIISMSLTPLLGEIAEFAGNYLESLEINETNGGTAKPHTMSQLEAQELFQKIDEDKSGSIELEELKSSLQRLGVSYVTMAEIFSAFDTDGDGIISKEEWADGVQRGVLATAFQMEEKAVDAGANLKTDLEIRNNAIVICGYTEFGKEMYRVLESCGAADNGGVVAFELNPARVSAGIMGGANVVYGDGASTDLLRAAGVAKPQAVIIAYRSEAKRLDATIRLRESLPPGTPIYARMVSGQVLGKQELLDAGATEVVSERTEAALQFASLAGAIDLETDRPKLRMGLSQTIYDSEGDEPEAIPGIPDARLDDRLDEFGCSRQELMRLYKIFSSLPGEGRFVAVGELRDVLLRLDDSPIDDAQIDRWMEFADVDGNGTLSFIDFARVYFSSLQEMKEGKSLT